MPLPYNQSDWDARVLNDPTKDVWQYFKMDEASGLPQDSGHYSVSVGCHMTAGVVDAHEIAGPFDGAKAISVVPADASEVVRSPVYNPSPALDVNFAFPKGIEAWVYLNEDPASDDTTLIGVGNVALQIDSDNKVKVRSFWNPGSVTSKSSMALSTGVWYFIFLDMLDGSSCDVYIGDGVTASLEVSAGSILWPVPNANFLRLGAAGAFNETGHVLDAYWSNCVLYDNAGDAPSFPSGFIPHIYRRVLRRSV